MAVKTFKLLREGFFDGTLQAAGSVVSFETDPDLGGMEPGDNLEPFDGNEEAIVVEQPAAATAPDPVVVAQPTALAAAAPAPAAPAAAAPEPRKSRKAAAPAPAAPAAPAEPVA